MIRMFDGADPFLLEEQGTYYLYCTSENDRVLEASNAFDTERDGKDGFYVYQSRDLIHWENKGLCLSRENAVGSRWFWAPEVLHRNGRYYMVYAAEEHLALAVSDSPLGPFSSPRQTWLLDRGAIDGHFFVDGDDVYLYYVGLVGENRIFVAKMAPDMQSVAQEYGQVLIQAEEPWETVDCRVTEGPFVLKHHGLYYLSYSANHTRSKDYAVGYAVSESPLGPFRKYAGNPVLSRYGDVEGTGHHSFAPTRDPNRWICAYHCHSGNPDNFKPRKVCLGTASFEPVPGQAEDRLVIRGG